MVLVEYTSLCDCFSEAYVANIASSRSYRQDLRAPVCRVRSTNPATTTARPSRVHVVLDSLGPAVTLVSSNQRTYLGFPCDPATFRRQFQAIGVTSSVQNDC